MKIEEPLRTSQLDPKFKYEIAGTPGGENIKYCFQCEKCTATCPVRRFSDEYKPAQIIRAALLGLTDILLTSDAIWFCATCYSCTQRCPQDAQPTEVIRAIRNLAVKKGYIHPFYKAQGNAIVNHGRIFEDDEFVNEMRGDMNLPPIPPIDVKEHSKLMELSGAKKLLS